ncbi:hypothetical protein BEWA_022680 [Theileria equi strain WA]|uniref:Uncharacterized protein n=1 Tax=Theileria equi strain WA TaxID=1537102 RepID=L0AV58_THEEQ|nr:hypothetical protein BEWA_022680 [Theileria equi strain WA]AFZ79420.1 hypothetical protein BEWA_022680 [Theileria equi strain WA]|eukprot:XP_004829086.1 hypothetical protein BEWA_022680 [Theileria equi strain WA]
MVICNNKVCIVDSTQMRSIADAMKPDGSKFDSDITYEIDGTVLTWIVNHSDKQVRFECANLLEIIDGYYKAEFFLETKRVFEVPSYFTNFGDATDVTFTSYLDGENYVDELEEYTTETGTTEEGSQVADAPTGKGKRGRRGPRGPSSKPRAPRGSKSSDAKSKNASESAMPSKHTESTKLKSEETVEQNYTLREKRNTSAPKPKTENPRAGDSKRGPKQRQDTITTPTTKGSSLFAVSTSDTDIHFPEDSSSDPKEDDEEYIVTLKKTTKRQKDEDYVVSDKKEVSEDDIETAVRRGTRIRKVSVFQDCYLPGANNEWISEVFIGTNSINF